MVVLLRCKHCSTAHRWDVSSAGVYTPASDRGRPVSSYGCLASATGACEPKVDDPGQRMVRELAGDINRRFARGGRSHKRR